VITVHLTIMKTVTGQPMEDILTVYVVL